MKINCVQSVQHAHVILKRAARLFSFSFLPFALNYSLSKCYHGSSDRTSQNIGGWGGETMNISGEGIKSVRA